MSAGEVKELYFVIVSSQRFLIEVAGTFRLEANTIELPSGDQTGKRSIAASDVNRTVRAPSISQRSVLPCTVRWTIALCPSGEVLGL